MGAVCCGGGGPKRRVYILEENEDSNPEKNRCSWILQRKRLSAKTGIEAFSIQGVIGEGLLGSVRLAKLQNNNKYCVLKCMSKAEVLEHKDERHVIRERNILAKMDHPFIVHYFGAFQDKLNIYLCLEMVAGGELFRYLLLKRKFQPSVAKFYTAEIFLALEYVHSLGWVYRDLKPENIMLDELGHVRLVDFGFAREPDGDGRCHTRIGTPQYLSPEHILSKEEKNGYTGALDWWAFGCLLFELLTGQTPFSKRGDNGIPAVCKRILSGKFSFPKGIDKNAKDLISCLLRKKFTKRMRSPTEIRAHAWFQDVPWGALLERTTTTPYKPTVSFPGDTSNFDSNYDDTKRAVSAKGRGKASRDDQTTFVGF